MDLEHSFTIPVSPERAWQTLLDVERVAPCMPGASVDSVEGDKISGRIKVKVGPVMLTYTGTARFTERDDQAHSVTLEASGRETRGSGTASAVVRSSLRDEGGGQTRVTVNTTLTVTGRPAQFGRGVMAEVGGKIIEKFATNLAAQLAGGEAGAPAAGAGAAPAPAAPGAGTGAGAGAGAGTAAGVGAGVGAGSGAGSAGERAASSAGEAARGLPIDELNLPVRAYNTLRREGVLTIGNLCDSTEARLLEFEHIGPQAIKEIRQKLAERGLSLAEPEAPAAQPEAPAAQPGRAPAQPAGPPPAGTAASADAAAAPSAASPAGAGETGASAAGAAPAEKWTETHRPPRPPEEEALDLLDVAGFPVLKRALPVAGGVAAVLLISWRLRRRWRRRHSAR